MSREDFLRFMSNSLSGIKVTSQVLLAISIFNSFIVSILNDNDEKDKPGKRNPPFYVVDYKRKSQVILKSNYRVRFIWYGTVVNY